MWSDSYFSENFHAADLIKLVKQQPALWNPYHANHSNKQVRSKAWEAIAEKIVKNWAGLPDKEKYGSVAEIKSKWKNIKDTYTKDQRLRRKGNASRKKRKYIYADMLQFLNFSMKPGLNFLEETEEESKDKELTSQIEDVKPNIVDAGLDEQNDSNFDLEELEDPESSGFKNELSSSDSDSSNDPPPPTTRNILFVDSTSTTPGSVGDDYHDDFKSRQSSSSGFVSSGSGGKKRPIEDVSRNDDGDGGDDPDKMFLLSMLPLFKNLSEHSKIVARIQLTQVLQKLLYPKKC